DPGFAEPLDVRYDGVSMPKGINGLLEEGEWTWYYNEDSTSAFLTIIVRLPGGVDPDTLDPDKIEAYWGEPEPIFIACTRPPPEGQTGVRLNFPVIGEACF